MKVVLFANSDIKKDGTLKKKNNSKEMTKEEFKQYVKEKGLSLSKGYIDLIGFISNGLKFRCYYREMIVGVTGLINEVEKWENTLYG